MSEHSNIGWTDASWNPIRGCSRVSSGCTHCYAEALAARMGHKLDGKPVATMTPGGPRWAPGRVGLVESQLALPLRWKKPRRIFVNSMSDLFHEALSSEEILAVFGIMACTPQHTYQILTKRPDRMKQWSIGLFGTHRELMTLALTRARANYPHALDIPRRWPLPNVWLGVSVEDQAAANERIPLLLETPAAVRFISAEPLLGPLVMDGRHLIGDEEYWDFLRGERGATVQHLVIKPTPTAKLDWVIVGGESGQGHRPMEGCWLEEIAWQCDEGGVPLFVKQDSGPRPGQQGRIPSELWDRKGFPA